MARKRGRFSKKFKIFLFGILLLVISASLLIFYSKILIVKKVNINLDKISCVEEDQIRDSIKLLGANIFFINHKKTENELKKKYICIKSVNFKRQLPDKVDVEILGREPVAIIISSNTKDSTEAFLSQFIDNISTPSAQATPSASFSGQEVSNSIFLIDNEGVLFGTPTGELPYPKIYFNSNLSLGQKIEDDLLKRSLEILEKTSSFGLNLKEARIYPPFLFLTTDGVKIIFKVDSLPDRQLASLQLILSQAKIKQDYIEFIDLRFDKPVIKTTPKKHG